MHEFSIANQAVDKIVETALDRGAKRIREVEILIGELNLLGGEQLIFWIKEMLNSKIDIASDVKIDLKSVQAIIKCNRCGFEGNLKPEKNEDHFHPVRDTKDTGGKNKISDEVHPKFFCPRCGQGDIEIKKGKEFVLNRIEIET